MRVFQIGGLKGLINSFIRVGDTNYVRIDINVQMGIVCTVEDYDRINASLFTELLPGTDKYNEVIEIYKLIDWLVEQ